MKPTTAKRIRVTIGAMTIVAGVSTASLAQQVVSNVDPNAPIVRQGPSFYPSFQPFRSANDNLPSSEYIVATKEKSLRGTIGEKLADWNVITPRNQMGLSVSCNGKEAKDKKVESVLWKFNKDDYFSLTDIQSDEVRVIAWRPFIATAVVKCEDDSKSRIYSAWVAVD